ncbi:MAG TPA: PBPRA1643 family SWIM/SEC-C metal-binding motif protein [Bryobacterales bacterium]|nr:PBPRA1643 family SWIM/SEC-C metal-binding motif protein [Bryobacterales bacterium]
MAKLGTGKRPAVVRVQSFERAEEILSLFEDHGWQVIVGVEPEEPEDLSDVEKLLGSSHAVAQNPPRESKVGRNAPCPCGSGRKFKKCCGS